jgi:hypothetical protein
LKDARDKNKWLPSLESFKMNLPFLEALKKQNKAHPPPDKEVSDNGKRSILQRRNLGRTKYQKACHLKHYSLY